MPKESIDKHYENNDKREQYYKTLWKNIKRGFKKRQNRVNKRIEKLPKEQTNNKHEDINKSVLDKTVSRRDALKLFTTILGAAVIGQLAPQNFPRKELMAYANENSERELPPKRNRLPMEDDETEVTREIKETKPELLEILQKKDVDDIWPAIKNLNNVNGTKPILLENKVISSYCPEVCSWDITRSGNITKPFFTFAAAKKYLGWFAVIKYVEKKTGKEVMIGYGKCQDTGGLIGDSDIDPEKRDIDVFAPCQLVADTIGVQPATIIMIPPGIAGATDYNSIQTMKKFKLDLTQRENIIKQIIAAAPEESKIKEVNNISELL